MITIGLSINKLKEGDFMNKLLNFLIFTSFLLVFQINKAGFMGFDKKANEQWKKRLEERILAGREKTRLMLQKINETIKNRLETKPVEKEPTSPTIPEVQYVLITDIHPGQIRYASQNVQDKVNAAIKKGGIFKDVSGQEHFKYFDGKSILPEKSALPVVYGPFGYVLVDGHHDVLSSLAVGAKYVPIKIIGRLRMTGLMGYANLKLTPEQFWIEAEKKNWVYPYALGGARQIPPAKFEDLVDDPNRYFAAIAARKCERKGQTADQTIGAEYPLWRKVGKDIPFIEFKISDALGTAGVFYDYNMGDKPPMEFVEKARQALKEHPVNGLKLVPERTKYDQIKNICEE